MNPSPKAGIKNMQAYFGPRFSESLCTCARRVQFTRNTAQAHAADRGGAMPNARHSSLSLHPKLLTTSRHDSETHALEV